ncbi:MAG: hypothetical protein JSU69_09780 [Candidatus Zixiibacteriota bacterium]|nr:MAG: hypothetical protein JSU69_09780 [candidate division Zixibacteria bacterium]
MEIGFSTDQLIDIGLNIAGFLTAGLLLLLARSLFAANLFPRACAEPKDESGSIPVSAAVQDDEAIPDVEFVDLKSMDWRVHKDSPGVPSEGSLRDKNRLEIIRMAKQMLAGKKSGEANGSGRVAVPGFPTARGSLNPQGTGRSR